MPKMNVDWNTITNFVIDAFVGYGIPRDFYLNIIAEGYKEFELPIEVLNTAVAHANEETKKDANAWLNSHISGNRSAI